METIATEKGKFQKIWKPYLRYYMSETNSDAPRYEENLCFLSYSLVHKIFAKQSSQTNNKSRQNTDVAMKQSSLI